MTEYVALLRGVNVGGVTVRSAELREVFLAEGFERVRPVLASGNVRFQAEAERGALKRRIEKALADRFGYDAWIVLVTREELRRVRDGFPFDAGDATRQPYVVFCVDEATRAELLTAAEGIDAGEDPIAAGPAAVYWNPQKGRSLDTPFAKLLGRAGFKPRVTTRNLRTVERILGA